MGSIFSFSRATVRNSAQKQARSHNQNLTINANTYMVMPTIELREFIRQLYDARAVAGGLASEIESFLKLMPYMSNYTYDPDAKCVPRSHTWYYRTQTVFEYHIALDGLKHDHRLILTKYQAEKLLEFEVRAGIVGSTPSLMDLRQRCAKKETSDPPVYNIAIPEAPPAKTIDSDQK